MIKLPKKFSRIYKFCILEILFAKKYFQNSLLIKIFPESWSLSHANSLVFNAISTLFRLTCSCYWDSSQSCFLMPNCIKFRSCLGNRPGIEWSNKQHTIEKRMRWPSKKIPALSLTTNISILPLHIEKLSLRIIEKLSLRIT